MPYQPPPVSYTPMPPWSPPANYAAGLPGQEDFLKTTMAALAPGQQQQASEFGQARALQEQELALARKAQQDQQMRFQYSTPPWGARMTAAGQPPPAAQAMPAPGLPGSVAAAPNHTPQEMQAAMAAGAKKFSGTLPSAEQLNSLLREAGFVQDARGRYVMPSLAY
jgi:hypothetical protein